jgi:hypothetical protein
VFFDWLRVMPEGFFSLSFLLWSTAASPSPLLLRVVDPAGVCCPVAPSDGSARGRADRDRGAARARGAAASAVVGAVLLAGMTRRPGFLAAGFGEGRDVGAAGTGVPSAAALLVRNCCWCGGRVGRRTGVSMLAVVVLVVGRGTSAVVSGCGGAA